ncbi:MAG TPA: DUF2203 domain-containing protein [Candidatus Baltobacteraceae bacterium]|nr:DUF2203 domain-containing protein [Candidatus Baltobacteraceae bacterium]
MAEQRIPRLYTVDEARELVGTLRPLLSEIRGLRREIGRQTAALHKLSPEMRGNGHAPEVARREGRIAQCIETIGERLNQIEELDIEVKDLDTGLVDFFSLRAGRIVYLCWAVDEPTVAYWHDIDAGFVGRQPIDP